MSALYSGPPREILQGGTVVLPSCGPSHERPTPLSGWISLALTHFNAILPPRPANSLFWPAASVVMSKMPKLPLKYSQPFIK